MTGISVVIPFFEDEKYFPAALDSVLSQTLPASEILVVVDGDCLSARAFFAKLRVPSLKVFFLPSNQGSAAARNAGIQNAQSDYIAFLDSDDVWADDKLEKQTAYMSLHAECAACHTGVSVFNDQGSSLAVYVEKPSRLEMRHLLNGNQVLTSSLLIRRDVILALGGFDIRFRTSQDFELILRLTQQEIPIGFIPEALTGLRRSSHGNISSRGKLLLRNHAAIAWMYRADLLRLGGVRGYVGFIAKYLVEDGSRMSGVFGFLVYQSGRILALLASNARIT